MVKVDYLRNIGNGKKNLPGLQIRQESIWPKCFCKVYIWKKSVHFPVYYLLFLEQILTELSLCKKRHFWALLGSFLVKTTCSSSIGARYWCNPTNIWKYHDIKIWVRCCYHFFLRKKIFLVKIWLHEKYGEKEKKSFFVVIWSCWQE